MKTILAFVSLIAFAMASPQPEADPGVSYVHSSYVHSAVPYPYGLYYPTGGYLPHSGLGYAHPVGYGLEHPIVPTFIAGLPLR